MVAVAAYQRINLFRLPVLLFVGSFGLLIFILYATLSQLPPEQMGKTIGAIGSGIILTVIVLFIAAGALKKQNVYDNFIDGAKDGFKVAIGIIPYLVAILVAISIFRTSGCMDYIVNGIGSFIAFCGLPTEFVPVLPMGLMKTLSGSGARGLMVDVMRTYGVGSFEGRLAAIVQGSTETTFYILAVYFGSVQIKHTRHALVCGLIADLVGLVAAIIIGYAFFGYLIP